MADVAVAGELAVQKLRFATPRRFTLRAEEHSRPSVPALLLFDGSGTLDVVPQALTRFCIRRED